MILLDTDICIEILRGNGNVIRMMEKQSQIAAVSYITVGELFYGSAKSNNNDKNKLLVKTFLSTVEIINFDLEIMEMFGEIKFELQKQGQMLPDADIIIASVALCKCQKLITGNTSHFSRFKNLTLENWVKNK
jgi:tRNA(fMet)-specific endonuclease VapC